MTTKVLDAAVVNLYKENKDQLAELIYKDTNQPIYTQGDIDRKNDTHRDQAGEFFVQDYSLLKTGLLCLQENDGADSFLTTTLRAYSLFDSLFQSQQILSWAMEAYRQRSNMGLAVPDTAVGIQYYQRELSRAVGLLLFPTAPKREQLLVAAYISIQS